MGGGSQRTSRGAARVDRAGAGVRWLPPPRVAAAVAAVAAVAAAIAAAFAARHANGRLTSRFRASGHRSRRG